MDILTYAGHVAENIRTLDIVKIQNIIRKFNENIYEIIPEAEEILFLRAYLALRLSSMSCY